MNEALQELCDAEVAAHGCVRPPWAYAPGVHPYDLYWRMGAGETHVMLFSAWADGRAAEELRAVLARFAPVPADWAWWAAEALGRFTAGDDGDEPPFDEVRRMLDEEGLTVEGEPRPEE